MKRWLAGKARAFVTRLTEPVTTRVLQQAHELHGTTLARAEALLGELARQRDSTGREIVEAVGRDLGAVVRMHAALDSSVADLQATLRRMGQAAEPASLNAVSATEHTPRYVTFLGASSEADVAEASAFLSSLRFGLDRLEDVAEGSPEIWIERPRGAGETDNLVLTQDAYVRVMKNGTQSIEVLTPADALAVRQALERNGRSDVQVSLRWIGTAVPGTRHHAIRQALISTDHWIFPSQGLFEAVQPAADLSAEDRFGKHIHIHPMPDATTANPVELARKYRASVRDVLGVSWPRGSD